MLKWWENGGKVRGNMQGNGALGEIGNVRSAGRRSYKIQAAPPIIGDTRGVFPRNEALSG